MSLIAILKKTEAHKTVDGLSVWVFFSFPCVCLYYFMSLLTVLHFVFYLGASPKVTPQLSSLS